MQIEVVCNTTQFLDVSDSVARRYSEKTGKSLAEASRMLSNLSNVAWQATGREVGILPGTAACGGIGAGLLVLTPNTELMGPIELMRRHYGLEEVLAAPWDVVFVADWELDGRPADGNVAVQFARLVKQNQKGARVIGIATIIDPSAYTFLDGSEHIVKRATAPVAHQLRRVDPLLVGMVIEEAAARRALVLRADESLQRAIS